MAYKLRRRDSNSRKMAGSKPATLGHFVTTHHILGLLRPTAPFLWRAKNNRKVFMKSKWNTPLVQNVEFESLFCVPNAACCHYTTFWIWCRRWDSNPRSVFQAELFKSPMYVTPSLRHIKAVCPAVNRLSDLPVEFSIRSSTHELVGIEGFGPSRLSTLGLETSVAAISPYPHIAGLSRLSAPRRAFSEEEISRYFVNHFNENHDKMSILLQLFC